jgi:hypothetical protein
MSPRRLIPGIFCRSYSAAAFDHYALRSVLRQQKGRKSLAVSIKAKHDAA